MWNVPVEEDERVKEECCVKRKIKESKVRGREMAGQSVREIFCKDMWWVTNG